jgi:hypothetical protein
MALSGPPVNDYGEQDPTRRALLVTTVLGPVLAFDLPVRPRVGALLQLAPNPAGSAGPAVLVGVVGLAGAEIPLGASPLAVRLGAELGVLGPMFCLRVGAQVVLGLGRMQAKVKR